jgi:hypothetical protein
MLRSFAALDAVASKPKEESPNGPSGLVFGKKVLASRFAVVVISCCRMQCRGEHHDHGGGGCGDPGHVHGPGKLLILRTTTVQVFTCRQICYGVAQ